jgi:hypothetical protein
MSTFRGVVMRIPIGTAVNIYAWYDAKEDQIKLRFPITPRGSLTSVNNNAVSKRGNPSLYKCLATVLRDKGKKHPLI